MVSASLRCFLNFAVYSSAFSDSATRGTRPMGIEGHVGILDSAFADVALSSELSSEAI